MRGDVFLFIRPGDSSADDSRPPRLCRPEFGEDPADAVVHGGRVEVLQGPFDHRRRLSVNDVTALVSAVRRQSLGQHLGRRVAERYPLSRVSSTGLPSSSNSPVHGPVIDAFQPSHREA
jgi:hypothetical protein